MTTTTTPIATLTLTPRRQQLRPAETSQLATITDQHAATSRIRRHIDSSEAATLIDTIRHHPTATRIRVYSSSGFVPNSYRFPAPIEWLEAARTDTGWTVTIGRGDAKRSGGNGPLVTIDGRSA